MTMTSSTQCLNIAEEFVRVETTKFKLHAAKFFSQTHKDDREWQVLGAAQKLLMEVGASAPIFAIKTECPDFYTFNMDGGKWGQIEIVEVLRPKSERHRFHKDDLLRSKGIFTKEDLRLMKGIFRREVLRRQKGIYDSEGTIEDSWLPLREQLIKKARNHYAPNVCLLVYFDISRSAFNDFETPFNSQLLAEHTRSLFDQVSAFRRVLVLNCDMKSLTELWPLQRTIVADDPWADEDN